MNILLCDDDIEFLESFENLLSDYNGHIYKFSTIDAVKQSDVIFDIAFLDIVLDSDKLVFDLIDHVRKNNPKCVISFVTNHIKYAPEGYEYKAFRYIVKTEPVALIKRRIEDIFKEYNRMTAIIRGSYKNEQFSISARDVCFIEIYNHILKLHTIKGEFEMYGQISVLYPDLLNWGFIRCHRSYVVNLNFVRTIADNSYFLLNTPLKTKIPLGIRYKSEAKDKFLNYAGENL